MFSKGATKQGYLIKKSQTKHRSLLKTAKKSRWFVLKDFFLFYFKSAEVNILFTPLNLISPQLFSCRILPTLEPSSLTTAAASWWR
jgi:hypothetical protein